MGNMTDTATFTLPFVIPEEIRINIERAIKKAVPPGSRVLVHPANALYTQLLHGGYLSHWKILGTLAFDENRQHTFIKATASLSEINTMEVDALLTVDPCHVSEPSPEAQKISRKIGCACINLCENYDSRIHRAQLEKQLDPMQYFWGAYPHCVEIQMPRWGLGDFLCGLTAAREFARRHPDIKILFNRIPKIVEAFGDNLVSPGKGIAISIAKPDSLFFWWEQKKNFAANYTDCYFLSLGLDSQSPPLPELPSLPPFEQLKGVKYIVLQPRAAGIFAMPHLPWSVLQHLIDASPLPVFLAGRKGSGKGLLGIDTSFAGDELDMLRLIQNAALILTPRSATAHIAAGYGIPSIVWLPDDHLNWHLDYPNWPVQTIPAASGNVEERLLDALSKFLGPELPLSRKKFTVTRTMHAYASRNLCLLQRIAFRAIRHMKRLAKKILR